MAKPIIQVAIAILVNENNVLVGWREEDQHQGNKHEFPGGKVENGETPLDACRREVIEEVGISLDQWTSFDSIRHEYNDVNVHLHFFLSYVPNSVLESIKEPWSWYSRNQLLDLNFPNANKAIIKRLFWPRQIKISEDLVDIKNITPEQLMYWRVDLNQNCQKELSQFSIEGLSKLIINLKIWEQLNDLQKQSISAIHLKESQLLALKKEDLKIGCRYIAACHNLNAVQHAQNIGCDAVFLSPVQETQTHPDTETLGWKGFNEIASQTDILMFALGGLSPQDLQKAIENYAYGVAGIRNF